MKILGNRHTGSRVGSQIAPTLAGSVVPAGLCELGDFCLKRLPSEAGAGSARLEDNGRPSRSRAENIETPAPDVHRPSNLRELRSVTPASYLLVDDARNED